MTVNTCTKMREHNTYKINTYTILKTIEVYL